MKRPACNICESRRLREILNLGKHPLADTFLTANRFEDAETHFPLALAECEDCGHVLTKYYIPPAKRYVESEYSYDSSNSPVSRAHFREFAGDIVKTYKSLFGGRLPRRATDIGSSVGTLLSYMANDFGISVVGIEPSANIAALAVANGVPTVCALFDEGIKSRPEFEPGSLDVVASTNVVNHIDDLRLMMAVIDDITSDEALLSFEVPYLGALLQQNAFDTVYHEHVNYFSIRAITRLLEEWGFRLAHLEKIAYMGGSIRVYGVRKGQASDLMPPIAGLLAQEDRFFQSNPRWREDFRADVLNVKRRLLAFVHREHLRGSRICCIGAATKGNTLLNYCKLDSDTVTVCCDVSALKVGKRMPGSAIPIVHDDELGPDWDYAIVLPWNLSDFLIDKFRSSGLSLIFPIQGYIINKDGKIESLA